MKHSETIPAETHDSKSTPTARIRELIGTIPNIRPLGRGEELLVSLDESTAIMRVERHAFLVSASQRNTRGERALASCLTDKHIEIEGVLPRAGTLSLYGLKWVGGPARGGLAFQATFSSGALERIRLYHDGALIEELANSSTEGLAQVTSASAAELLMRLPVFRRLEASERPTLTDVDDTIITHRGISYHYRKTRFRQEGVVSASLQGEDVTFEQILPSAGVFRRFGFLWQGGQVRGHQHVRLTFQQGALVRGEVLRDGSVVEEVAQGQHGRLTTRAKVSEVHKMLAMVGHKERTRDVTTLNPGEFFVTTAGDTYRITRKCPPSISDQLAAALQKRSVVVDCVCEPSGFSGLHLAYSVRQREGQPMSIQFESGKPVQVEFELPSGERDVYVSGVVRLKRAEPENLESLLAKLPGLTPRTSPETGPTDTSDTHLRIGEQWYSYTSRSAPALEPTFTEELRKAHDLTVRRKLPESGQFQFLGLYWNGGPARADATASVRFEEGKVRSVSLYRGTKLVEELKQVEGHRKMRRVFLDKEEADKRVAGQGSVLRVPMRPRASANARSPHYLEIALDIGRLKISDVIVKPFEAESSTGRTSLAVNLAKGRTYQQAIFLKFLAEGTTAIPELLVRTPGLYFPDLFFPAERIVVESQGGGAPKNIGHAFSTGQEHLNANQEERIFDSMRIVHLTGAFESPDDRISFERLDCDTLDPDDSPELATLFRYMRDAEHAPDALERMLAIRGTIDHLLSRRLGILDDQERYVQLKLKDFEQASLHELDAYEKHMLQRLVADQDTPRASLACEKFCYDPAKDRILEKSEVLPLEAIRLIDAVVAEAGAKVMMRYLRKAAKTQQSEYIISAATLLADFVEKIPPEKFESSHFSPLMLSIVKRAAHFLFNREDFSSRTPLNKGTAFYHLHAEALSMFLERQRALLGGASSSYVLDRFVTQLSRVANTLERKLREASEPQQAATGIKE